MINVIVLDVDESVHQQLEFLLHNYFSSKNEEVVIRHYYSSDSFLKKEKGQIDMLILDAQLPGYDGIKIAKRFRKTHLWQPILFCSSVKEYAISGYQVSAIGFLLKPINEENFKNFIEKGYNIIKSEKKRRITIRTREGEVHLFSEDILYIEIRGHVLHIHYFDSGKVINMKCRGSLSEYEKILEPCGFARCCVYALVNMKYVSGVKGTEVYLSKTKEGLPLSRSNRNEFIACFTNFLSGSVIQAA